MIQPQFDDPSDPTLHLCKLPSIHHTLEDAILHRRPIIAQHRMQPRPPSVVGNIIAYPSCHLWVEDRKDRGSQDKEHRLEFEAIGCDSMNVFWHQALYLATGGFDSFAIVCEQESHPRLPRSF